MSTLAASRKTFTQVEHSNNLQVVVGGAIPKELDSQSRRTKHRDCSSNRAEGRPNVIGRTYRLKIPTLAIMTVDGQKIPVTIPLGGTVEVINTDINGNRLVDVTWEGRTVIMFTTDLRERGEVVTARVVTA